jgi:capsid protein
MFHANPGEKIEGIERNIPGQNFSESLRMFLRMLGLPLGIPLEIVLLDWTQSNYSQSRAVLQQSYQTFMDWQEMMKSFFYTPQFEWKLEQWRTAGLVSRRNNIQHEWITPDYPWLDQLKEAKAWATQVERGFVTHAQVCKSLNSDRIDIVNRRELEVRDAIKRSQEIEKETQVKVPWEMFCGMKGKTSGKELAEDADVETEDEDSEE